MNVPSPLLRYSDCVGPAAARAGRRFTGTPFQLQLALDPGFGNGSKSELEIIRDEQVEMAVTIVIDEGAPGSPAVPSCSSPARESRR